MMMCSRRDIETWPKRRGIDLILHAVKLYTGAWIW